MTRQRARIRWSKDAELLRLGSEYRKLLRRYHETLIAACLKSATAPEEAQWIGRYPYPAAMPPDDYARHKAAELDELKGDEKRDSRDSKIKGRIRSSNMQVISTT